MKNKSEKERLEDKIIYFYSQYGKNGYNFDKHMEFGKIDTGTHSIF